MYKAFIKLHNLSSRMLCNIVLTFVCVLYAATTNITTDFRPRLHQSMCLVVEQNLEWGVLKQPKN